MVCEFKNIRAIVAAGIITLAACSGDKICEPPTPQIESSSSAISSSSDNGGSEPATTSSSTVSSSSSSKDSKADDSSSSTKSSSSVSVEKPSSSSAELSPKPFWNDEFDGDAIDNSNGRTTSALAQAAGATTKKNITPTAKKTPTSRTAFCTSVRKKKIMRVPSTRQLACSPRANLHSSMAR